VKSRCDGSARCQGLLVEAASGVLMVLRSRDDGSAAGLEPAASAVRRQELFAFFVLAIFIWPILAVGIVGAYGFVVWMSQLILGPPGPPPV
jgi:nitrate reductase NapE